MFPVFSGRQCQLQSSFVGFVGVRDLHLWGGDDRGVDSTSICTQTAPPPSLPQEVAGKWQLCVCCGVSCFEMSILIRFGFIFWGLLCRLGSCQPCGMRALSFDFFFWNLICQLEVVTAVDPLIPISPPEHFCFPVLIFFPLWVGGHRVANSVTHQQGYTFNTSDANSLSKGTARRTWDLLWHERSGFLEPYLICSMIVYVVQSTWASELLRWRVDTERWKKRREWGRLTVSGINCVCWGRDWFAEWGWWACSSPVIVA